jgi:TPR repeat protein
LALFHIEPSRGNQLAQINLDTLYDKGDGVRQYNIMAYMWINLVTKQGNEATLKLLETLSWRMSIQQKKIAKQLTEECEAKKLKGCE